ncbi:MAG: MBL fold metallo-hydrolase [Flavobacterium sp.]|nr:MAG: MBL fold metallo-hydrolase [Flavobacterium sp.]
MKIHFLGGAGTVTGSKTLLEIGGIRILIDCGLFQGVKALRERNWEPLAIPPSTIDFVLLTHGHLDHCGWLPCLVEQGFTGEIYCSRPTKDVAKLILLDSAKIQEEEASRANKQHFSKHDPALPLYTIAQAEKTFPRFRVVETHLGMQLSQGINVLFFPSGHIIGACSISIEAEGKHLIFSGDLGRASDPLMYPPEKPKYADYIFLESTYGNRLHPIGSTGDQLSGHINQTTAAGGTVIIPAFAIERVQTVMHELWQLKKKKEIPNIPYIVDTPMGINVLDIFRENPGWHKLTPGECDDMCEMFLMLSDYSQTMETIFDERPKVVLAASGMLTGGRVLAYLEKYIRLPQTLVILSGYQAEGTRGRKLLDGAQEIKIFGRYQPVNAKVVEIKGWSAHADQTGLLDWLEEIKTAPECIYLVHGENQSADTLRIKINEKYGWNSHVPFIDSEISL